jgi:transposase
MHTGGENMSDDFFDFGFTAVDESELQAVQDAQKTVGDVEVKATSTQEKLDKLYNAIQPLLTNLKKNPEKEYILWPNRIEKVDQFEDYLRKIYNS